MTSPSSGRSSASRGSSGQRSSRGSSVGNYGSGSSSKARSSGSRGHSSRGGGGRGGPGGGGGFGGGGAEPTVFYSRRIGLSDGKAIPILGRGRVTGKAGRFGFGAMSLQTDNVRGVIPSTNYTVVRVKRDVLRRSSIGAVFTNRSEDVINAARPAFMSAAPHP